MKTLTMPLMGSLENDKVWNSMMRELGGGACGLLNISPCPVCMVEKSILTGYASREGHVFARCSTSGCWSNDDPYGKIATRPK